MSSSLAPIYRELKERNEYVYSRDSFRDEKAYSSIIACRARLIERIPFFGLSAMNLVLVETRLIPTLAVDHFHFFYNPDFVHLLTDGQKGMGELEFGVGHEVLHVVLDHCRLHRMGSRNPLIWGYATDYTINLMLVEAQCGKLITTIKILYDEKYKGMGAEEVYDLLEQDPPPSLKRALDRQQGKGKGQGNSGGKGQPGEEDGSANAPSDSEGGRLDDHVMFDDGTLGYGNAEGPQIPKEMRDKLLKDWADVIQQAAAAQHEAEERGTAAGFMPAGLRRYIDSLIEPKVFWRDVLRHYVNEIVTYQYSYARPNKALFNSGMTIPGFRHWDSELQIAVAIDASGSIGSEELQAFISELKGILDSFPEFCVKIWSFDGVVHPESYMEYTKGNADELMDFKIMGGGGTTFEANWDFMREREIMPKLFLMFTDGFPCGGWGEDDYCPTMFLIKGGTNPPPFGMYAFYDDGGAVHTR